MNKTEQKLRKIMNTIKTEHNLYKIVNTMNEIKQKNE